MEQITQFGVPLTCIHFIYPTKDNPGGDDWRIACMPNMTEFHATVHHPNYLRTNYVGAVTCPQCKKTDAYRRATGGK